MKKAGLIALIGLFMSGCSYTDLLAPPPTSAPLAATDTATLYVTPTATPTITPTQPTPTFTATPTLIYPNGTPIPGSTGTPPETLSTAPAASATPTAQALIGGGPFTSILVSGQKLFWGSCDPSAVVATVKVADGVPAAVVTIWLRLEDVKTGDTTSWGGGAIMKSQGNGVFTYTLTAKSFTHYREYLQAWGQYQFVASDSHLNRLGATAQYLSNLTIAPCP
jgi:hypothetical protein